ncbi:Carbon monoxide dehydrogenase medium chain [archaeon HR01]|nr:Carbon monoxide dehydrogenase medium chain [archaeon HR01]
MAVNTGGEKEVIHQPFEYFAPKTINEALKLLNKYREDAKILAGGQSLVPMMNLGIVSPKYVIDINNIGKLSEIRENKNQITIAPLVRHYEIAESKIIKRAIPMLSEAASHIGDMHIRHRGTIGGAICHADPAADYAPVLAALDAKLEIQSVKRRRIVSARNFFKDAFTTELKPNELLKAIHIQKVGQRTGTAYQKLEFVSGGYAVVGVAALVALDGEGLIEKLVVSVGGVERRPITIVFNGDVLGRKIENATIEEICGAVKDKISEPLSDIHADGEYRRSMAAVYTKRAVLKAANRALGGE